VNGFEDDEHFFASYQPEQANSGQSQTDLDFEEAPPSQAQLAHWARFRRPVGSFVAAMALLSVVALVKRDSERDSMPQRELVAHFGAAVAAPSVAAAPAQPGAAPSAPTVLLPSALAHAANGFCPAPQTAGVAPRPLFAQPYANATGVCSAGPSLRSPVQGGARVPASQLAVR